MATTGRMKTDAEVLERREQIRRSLKKAQMKRFLDNVDFGHEEDSCWLWTGTINKTDGYGRFHVNGEHPNAHRWAYEHLTGINLRGLVLHHKCSNRHCVRISHLEAMTLAEHTKLHMDLKKSRQS